MEWGTHSNSSSVKNESIQKEKVLSPQKVVHHFNLVPRGDQDKDKMAAIPATSVSHPRAWDTEKQQRTNPQN